MFRTRRRSGITLVELLVVLAILGLIAGVSTPAFLNFLKTFQVRNSGRQILGDLNLARQKAITRSRDVYVFFTPASGPDARGSYEAVVSDFQNGTDLGTNDSVRYFGPSKVAEHVDIVLTAPTGATATPFPQESLAGVVDQEGNALPDYTNVRAVVFYPNGQVDTAGAVWVKLPDGSGPRYTWMELAANTIGKVEATPGPPG